MNKFHVCLWLCLCHLLTSNLVAQTITLGQGNNDGIVVTTSDNAQQTNGSNTTTSQGFLPNYNSASRFLSQATFGPNYEEIVSLSQTGIENWIDVQMSTPKAFNLVDKMDEYYQIRKDNNQNSVSNYLWDFAWWQYAMTSPDYLRQRVAFALSEFFVISSFTLDNSPFAFADYHDMLLDQSFGNYRSLIDSITYHPAMGEYLTYMRNAKSDTTYNINWSVSPPDTISIQYLFPDENYAREVMQLFSIGLCELNMDGTCKKDGDGVDIPTYDNEDIAEFAKVFTGLGWGSCPNFNCFPWDENNPELYIRRYQHRMKMYDEEHEPGKKYLLNGASTPDGSSVDGDEDIRLALDNLFNHDNVGPFLGKFLIQRLVTSNPSAAYVTRVAEAFNGTGPFGTDRGDLKSVIKAILLDEEARSCSSADDDHFGMLREPFVRYVQLAKAFDLYTESGNHRNAMYEALFQIQQKPYASPSVFNFFQSDFQPIGVIESAGKVAPEFQITNSQSISGYLNGLTEWVMRGNITDEWRIYEGEPDFSADAAILDFTDELNLVEDGYIPQLVERLNLILAHGKLSQTSMDVIIDAIQNFEIEERDCVMECTPYCDPGDPDCDDTPDAACIMYCEDDVLQAKLNRVRIAIYLVMSSPEYLINR